MKPETKVELEERLDGGAKPRLTVISPLLPTSAEPYRGQAIFRTIVAMQRWAEMNAVCPLLTYPAWKPLQPRSLRYHRNRVDYSPPEMAVNYVKYPALPVVSRPVNGVTCTLHIWNTVRRYRPEAILAYWLYPEGAAARTLARWLGVPVIVGSRGSDLKAIDDPITRWHTSRLVRAADAVLTVSADSRRAAIELGARPEAVHSIPNGCDTALFRPLHRQEMRYKLGLALDAELGVFVGWLSKLKGVRELVEAMARLSLRRPRLQLVLIGEGELERELLDRAAGLGLGSRIRLLGKKSSVEIAEWFGASNFVVLPSYTEGCPNVVIEAISCGRPVVASDVGGVPELLNPACGILTPPGDVEALAASIEEALARNWDQEEIGRNHRRSWEDVARETWEVVEAARQQRLRR